MIAVVGHRDLNGRDATAHLVAFARTRGIQVEIVWPEGSVRGQA